MTEEVKISVANSNLASKINQVGKDIDEDSLLSPDLRRVKNLLERKLWVLDWLLIIYLFILTFFEKPHWCILKGSAMTDDCQEDVHGRKYFLFNLIAFSNKKVFLYSSMILIYFNVKYVILYSSLQQIENKNLFESDRKVRLVFLTCFNVLHFLFYFLNKDGIIYMDGPSLIKTFAIIFIIDWLYFTLKKIVNYILNFYEVFLFFILNWFFIAAVLEVLFVSLPDYYDHHRFYSFNFASYAKSLFSVFVFFTNNNSPEIIMKDFSNHKYITPIFISIIFINNLLLIALLIGLSYYKMKLAMAKEISNVSKDPVLFSVFKQLIPHPDVSKPFIKKVIIMQKQNKTPQIIEIDKILEEEEEEGFVKTRASEHIFSVLKSLKSYEIIYAFIDACLVLFALYVISTKAFDRYHYFLFSVLLSAIIVLDFLHHAFFYNIWDFDKTWKTIVDSSLSVVISIFAFTIIANKGESVVLVKFWAFFCICKSFRIFMIYFRFDRSNIRTTIIYPFMRYIYDVVTQQILLFFIFSSLGFNVFGGNINSKTVEIYNQEMGTEYEFTGINLNTFLNSLVFFFVVTINNDWPVIANLSVIAHSDNRRLMKFMFVIFKLYVNYILLNSLIAFIIEILYNYTNVKEKKEKEDKKEKKEEDDVMNLMEESMFKNVDQPMT